MMLVLLISLTLVADSPNLSQEFRRDFTKGDFDLLLTGPGAGEAVVLGRGGVQIKLPGGHKEVPPVGFASRMPVRGDFEITVSYGDLAIETPLKGSGVGLSLYITLNSPRQEAASVAHLLSPKGRYAFIAHRAQTPPKGARHHDIESMPAKAGGGKLRLSRTGSTLHYLTAQGGGDFQQIHQFEVGLEDLDLIRVAVEPGKVQSGVSVLIPDLMVRADEFPGTMKAISRRTLRLAVGGLAALMGCVGAVAGWWLYKRRGSQVSPVSEAR